MVGSECSSMSEEPEIDRREVEHRGRGGELNLRGAAALLLLLRWVSRQEQKRDPDSAGAVWLNERAANIAARARQLAAEGREDQAAVDELAALAGRHRRALRQAERSSRGAGLHRETRRHDRA